ncbi:SDR family NAD(P)-dependent oxidoreductase [Micromonospora sp. CPCC 206061]|uniref:SDR family NAD(P)-dependent oxidoreductase n=1 Tax=Micromonospora sp. CPCC 206061 TaxID=3122410 RepID=UPI002FEF514E
MTEWQGIAGKTVLITGGTGGIGLAAARELAARGARLGIVARDEGRAAAAVDQIRSSGGGGSEVEVFMADLASQASVRQLAADVLARYPRLDALVNNAGAVNMKRQVTADGIELTWAVNHLAPFLLTELLLDRLKESAPARVITTASDAHRTVSGIPFDDLNAERKFQGMGRYGVSKLANILFTAELARRVAGSGVTATSFHPGFVASGFNLNNGAFFRFAMKLTSVVARSPEKGAETLVWLLDTPDGTLRPGGYYKDRREVEPTRSARDEPAARRLWEVSEAQTRATA